MESDLGRSWDAGFAEHFTKPVDVAALESAMHRALSGSGNGEADNTG
jgi:hypothetical protein